MSTAVFERCAACAGDVGATRVHVEGQLFHPRCVPGGTLDARVRELEGALRQIKAICAGDRLPHWKEDMFTVTVTRGRIMDLCEIADK